MEYHIVTGRRATVSNLDFSKEDIEEFHILKDEMLKLFSKYCKWDRMIITVQDGKEVK